MTQGVGRARDGPSFLFGSWCRVVPFLCFQNARSTRRFGTISLEVDDPSPGSGPKSRARVARNLVAKWALRARAATAAGTDLREDTDVEGPQKAAPAAPSSTQSGSGSPILTTGSMPLR